MIVEKNYLALRKTNAAVRRLDHKAAGRPARSDLREWRGFRLHGRGGRRTWSVHAGQHCHGAQKVLQSPPAGGSRRYGAVARGAAAGACADPPVARRCGADADR